ncbi:ABC transporter ATP-binding protein [Candidatus Saccharibacteria bacterium]|nr:ABC transporter ATP-binding protein [Candidatus Saccharibacteria bacterium]
MATEDTLVSLVGVSKTYQTQEGPSTVLKDVNFKIKRGTFTIIFGPSGSGKTTILNMILGLLSPSAGRVIVDGRDLYNMNQNERAKFRARNFGMVYQSNNWVSSLSVVENIAMPLYLSGHDRAYSTEQALESLRRVDLEKYANYSPQVLSIGQQQRISMARATVSVPMLLVADEPSGNLDSKNGDMIMRLTTSFKSQHDSTIILVTHNSDYLPLSDHRLYINDGVVTEDTGGYRADIDQQFNKVASMMKLSRSVKEVLNEK